MRLVNAELIKLRSTSTWWVFALITVVLWAATFFIQWQVSLQSLEAPGSEAAVAADLYTSGQFFGLLMVMLLSSIVVTNEFQHQTATTTFLQTPRRERVVLAKLAVGILMGIAFWLVTTVLNVGIGSGLLSGRAGGAQLGESSVLSAIGLNALAYALWAILGVAGGILIRSQIGATITLAVVYVIGFIGVQALFYVLSARFGDWIDKLQLLVPSIASQLMVTGADLPGNPPRWAGAVVLILYALVAGLVGTIITKNRDIT
jgi:ABC-2 type transport system permease protein